MFRAQSQMKNTPARCRPTGSTRNASLEAAYSTFEFFLFLIYQLLKAHKNKRRTSLQTFTPFYCNCNTSKEKQWWFINVMYFWFLSFNLLNTARLPKTENDSALILIQFLPIAWLINYITKSKSSSCIHDDDIVRLWFIYPILSCLRTFL